MKYILEIWRDGVCDTALADTLKQAEKIADKIHREYAAANDKSELPYDVSVRIHISERSINYI